MGRGRSEDLRAKASAEIDVAAVTVEGSPQKHRNRENSAPFPCKPPPKPAIPACLPRSSTDTCSATRSAPLRAQASGTPQHQRRDPKQHQHRDPKSDDRQFGWQVHDQNPP
jgi:hypothetical protein